MALWGKTDAAASVPKYLNIGRIYGVQVLTGGTGYTNGASQTVTFSAPAAAGGVTATGTALVSGGIVQSITITNPGSGYTSAPTLTIPGASNATFFPIRQGNDYVPANIVFVDDTEAAVASNKTKGITSPGWWHVITKSNDIGDIQYKAEMLAAITSVTADAGDKEEDLVVPDVTSVASISVQPANQTTVSGAATFAITAAISGGGSIAYQWQLALAATPTKFVNVGGATAASIVLSGKTGANTGDKYRCVITGGGVKALNSSAATLTFGT